jgi:hypothetical protein
MGYNMMFNIEYVERPNYNTGSNMCVDAVLVVGRNGFVLLSEVGELVSIALAHEGDALAVVGWPR